MLVKCVVTMQNDLVIIAKQELVSIIRDVLHKVLREQQLDKFLNRQKFSPKEAAEFTGRKESYIRMLIRDGKIPFQKDGKLVYLLRMDLLPLKK